MKRNLMITVLAMALVLVLAPMSRAVAADINFPASMFTIKHLGDVTIVLREGEPQAIVARDQKFVGNDVYVTVNGAPYTAYVALGSNLTLMTGTMPLKFEHTGTVDFKFSGGSTLSLEYYGTATKTKEMHTKTLNSYGGFVITDGTGPFADLKGGKGTYTLTFVCSGTGEKPMVGDPVTVTFSAMGE
jgi:hypothetical protein